MHSARIAVIGLSHQTASIALREQLRCTLDNLPAPWPAANGRFAAIQEAAILSTCNRTEIYAAINCPGLDPRRLLIDLLHATTGVDTAVFIPHLYIHTGKPAVNHLCRVAAGLDSLVLGEPQILGQVTHAFNTATAAKTIGPILTTLFRIAIRTGKRARTETEISTNPVSTSAIAVAQAQAILGDITTARHLVIGLGEMGQLALKALQARGATHIAVANRTRARAEALAAAYNWQVHTLPELPAAIAAADVVFSATSAATPLITRQLVAQVMAARGKRPLILIDIALPRNIDPAASNVPGVHLFDADTLQSHLDDAYATRQAQIPQVEAIIAAEVESFIIQIHQLSIKPVIVDLRQKAEEIRQQELARTLRHLENIDPQTLDQIQHLTRSLVNKLLHEPTLRLKASAGEAEGTLYADALRDLFNLHYSTGD